MGPISGTHAQGQLLSTALPAHPSVITARRQASCTSCLVEGWVQLSLAHTPRVILEILLLTSFSSLDNFSGTSSSSYIVLKVVLFSILIFFFKGITLVVLVKVLI